MTFQSQLGHVGFRTQSVKGTYADPGATAPNQGVFVRTRSGSMSGNRDLLIPEPEIGGNRDVPDVQLGPINFPGSFDIYPRWESLPFFLKSALGSAASAGSGATGYTHTIAPADTIPWVSVEENIGGGYQVFKYTDVKVNTFHMEADATGYLMGTVGLIGLTQANTTATILANQRRDNSELTVGTNILVQWNGANLPAKSFAFDIDNQIEDDDFRLGSLFLGDAMEKRRLVTGSVTIRPEDAALWKTAMWGSPAATQPLGTSFKDDLVIVLSSYTDIPGATAGIKYTSTFTLTQTVIQPFDLTPSGDDILEHDMSFQVVRPGTPDLLGVTVKNSFVTVP